MPAYQLNLGFQGFFASICDVIPGVLRLQELWEHMEVETQQQELIYFLIIQLQRKFEHELNSPVYQVL